MVSMVDVVTDVTMEVPLIVMATTGLLCGMLSPDWFSELSKLKLDCDRLAMEKSEAANKANFANEIFNTGVFERYIHCDRSVK